MGRRLVNESMSDDIPDGELELSLARAVLRMLELLHVRGDTRWRSTFSGFASQLGVRLWKPELTPGTELYMVWAMADDFVDEELEPMPDLDRARHERTRVALVEWANGVLANAKERTSEVDAT